MRWDWGRKRKGERWGVRGWWGGGEGWGYSVCGIAIIGECATLLIWFLVWGVRSSRLRSGKKKRVKLWIICCQP